MFPICSYSLSPTPLLPWKDVRFRGERRELTRLGKLSSTSDDLTNLLNLSPAQWARLFLLVQLLGTSVAAHLVNNPSMDDTSVLLTGEAKVAQTPGTADI